MAHALLQRAQQRIDVVLTRQTDHDIQLLHFHVQWIVIFAEEYAHFTREDVRSLLQQQIDVAEGYPLYLWGIREKGD